MQTQTSCEPLTAILAVGSGDLLAAFGRAQLGIDGNCGFALLGPDIQEGEAEFVEIAPTREAAYHAPLGDKLSACKQALEKLRERLNLPSLSYYFGPSHPYGSD
jgi:hypothetical protein